MIVSLVAPDGERTMASDRGVAPTLGPAEIEDGWFTGCTWLLPLGLRAGARPDRFAAARARSSRGAEGARVSVDLSLLERDPGLRAEAFRRSLEELGPDAVFCNEVEDRIVGGRLPGPAWILKRGADGCLFDGG